MEAFQAGEPEQVYALVREVLDLARLATDEAGEARFRTNFGSPRCDNCTGLKAGPGVVATCFQVKRCYYTNIRASDVTPKQQRVIEGLVSPTKPLT